MAQLALSAAGSYLGNALAPAGFLGMSGAQWGWMAGSLAGSLLAKRPNTMGPRLGDLRVTGTDFGATYPWVAGQPRIAGQIAWASDKRELAQTESVGKGGSGKYTGFTYEVDLLIILTENPIAGVSRIWYNGELVWDGTTTKSGVWGALAIYPGTPDQMPDPTYEAGVGVGNAPANRDRGSVVITSLQLGSSGQIGNLTFEIVGVNGLIDEVYTTVIDPPTLVYTSSTQTRRAGVSWFGGALRKTVGNWVDTSTNYAGFGAISFSSGTPGYQFAGTIYTGDLNQLAPGTSYTCVMLAQQAPNFDQTEAILYFPEGKYQRLVRPNNSGYDNHYFVDEQDIVYWVNYNIGTNESRLDTYVRTEYENTFVPPAFVHSHDKVAPLSSTTLEDVNFQVIALTEEYLYALGGPNASSPTARVYRLTKGGVLLDEIDISTEYGTIENSVPKLMARWKDKKGVVVAVPTSAEVAEAKFIYIGDDGSQVDMGNSSIPGAGADAELITAGSDLYCVFGTSPGGGVNAIRYTITGGQVVSLNTSLQFACEELLERCGYASDEFDCTALSAVEKPMRAMAISQLSNTRTPLEMLQQSHFYEPAVSDRLYLRPRSETPVASISRADLGASGSPDGEDEPLAIQFGNEMEIPAQTVVTYNNMASDYNLDAQSSDRLLTGQKSPASVQLALGMLPAEAKGVANGLLLDQIASMSTTTVNLPLKYARLEPGDIITAPGRDGRQYRLKIRSKRDTIPVLSFDCSLDDVGALAESGVTDDDYGDPTEVVQVAPTDFEVLDIPLLRDADDTPGYYVAVCPRRSKASDQWPGAVFVRAWSGSDFSQMFITSEACTMGGALTQLGDWDGRYVFDETNRVTVEVFGSLASTSRALLLQDLSVNAMLVGDEIIRFRTAELVSSDAETGRSSYVLSGLLRAQRGTEYAATGHVADERVVLLNTRLRRVETDVSQIGLVRQVKAVTLNTLLSSVEAEEFTDTGESVRPFSVANLRVLSDGGDLVLTWQRRSRLSYRYGGEVGVSVPLGEAAESYLVSVYDGTTLVATYTTTEPTYRYLAANIASDGFVSSDEIGFSVAQISEIIGSGHVQEIDGVAP